MHCNLKINIYNRQTDGSSGLNLDAASVVNIVGNVTGGDGHGIANYSAGTVIVNGNVTGGGQAYCGIFNASTGMVRVKNGTISNFGTTATSYPIIIYENNSLILENCKIIGVHVDVPAIYSLAAQNVYLMNVYSNRDLHSNITNLISGGFTYDSDVPSP